MRKIEDEHHKFASVWLDKHGNFPIAEKDFDHLFLIRAVLSFFFAFFSQKKKNHFYHFLFY